MFWVHTPSNYLYNIGSVCSVKYNFIFICFIRQAHKKIDKLSNQMFLYIYLKTFKIGLPK